MFQSQQDQIASEDVLRRFDAAVDDSLILWASTDPIGRAYNGFQAVAYSALLQLQFRICDQFSAKPQLPDVENQDEKISDICNPPDLRIAFKSQSHVLTFNAYPVLRPSFLLLTTSPTYRQTSPLDHSDFKAAWTAIQQLEKGGDGDQYMMIYNCGRESGCSRSHKHMQLFPRPTETTLFPDRLLHETLQIPYTYYLTFHDPERFGQDIPSTQLSAYLAALQHARKILGLSEGEYVPHNVVLVRQWILVIPRRKAGVQKISTNAAGMVGLVWVGSRKEMEEWERYGPIEALREMGVAAPNEVISP
ncbi:MAG: hypothetical protein Q9227_003754 [Pyrenula ochraceoflavens]